MKVCAKKPCLRSRDDAEIESVGHAAERAGDGGVRHAAGARLLAELSQRSKLRVFLQFGSFGLGALLRVHGGRSAPQSQNQQGTDRQ